MKKKASLLQSEIDNIKAQIAWTLIRVAQEEGQGHHGTYYHEKLSRLNGRLSEIENMKDVENTED